MAQYTQCPVPVAGEGDVITLAHGEGGGLTRRLISERILPVLGNAVLNSLSDAAVLQGTSSPWLLTTDSYVVSPLFFPGGNIGSLAVHGTVNDLLVAGGLPICLSLGLIMEEGFPLRDFDTIIASIGQAAQSCGVMVATGDTKVVPRGACDGIYINTTGLGQAREPLPVGPASIQPGDVLIVSGVLAQHGVSILASREELGLEPLPESDSASVQPALAAIQPWWTGIRALRDPTRGGLAAVAREWAEAARCTLAFEECRLPVSTEAQAICELLGIDPWHLASEGCVVLAVAPECAAPILAALQEQGYPRASLIGHARPRDVVPVVMVTSLGRERPLIEPQGAPLPRIC